MNQAVRASGENIPPLVNSYMNLSATMRMFGTCLNPDFGEVEESGILVTIPDIYPSKKERHIDSYLKQIFANGEWKKMYDSTLGSVMPGDATPPPILY